MRYISTRGAAPVLPFDEVLLAGLARDGGLYVPEAWPSLTVDDIRDLRGLPYAALAARLMQPFLGEAIAEDDFAAMVAESYGGFGHDEVAPLVPLGEGEWLLELFHGPTLAFKDIALQLLGRLFDHVQKKRGERVTIVGATSGDTGSAAIAAFRDRAALEIFMLHPQGRVSEVQRRQMTTVDAANVHNIAIDGTFDDCQDLVKAMFNDPALRDRLNLSAVNSINWARVMAQSVYYFFAALKLGAPDRAVAFAVPTGNFGNVYAGYGARAMGLGIERLVVGSNRNDILTRFLASGEMTVATVEPTLSPSMDIQISSNFERYLFDLYGRDGARVAAAMDAFRQTGRLAVSPEELAAARTAFEGHRFSDDETVAAIREVHDSHGVLVDPHTAVGILAGRAARHGGGLPPETPLVALATAHPAKFPDAVERATGIRPALPPHLADLMERPESCAALPNDAGVLRAHILDRTQAATGKVTA